MTKRLGIACFLLVFGGLLFACPVAGAETGSAGIPPVKIGVMLCLTGDCAEWGNNSLNGAKLAEEEINYAGGLLGRKIDLVIQDSRDTVPSQAVNAFQALLQDPEIHYILGPSYTAGGMSIAALIARQPQIVVISPSIGVKRFTETSANIFSIWPHDEASTRAIARYAIKNGWKRAAIFGSQDPFYVEQTRILIEEFQSLGGSFVAQEEPLPDAREVRAEALRIKTANPQAVMLMTYQLDVDAKELRTLGYKGPLLAVQMEKDRIKNAAGALEQCVFAMFEKPAPQFVQSYRTRFAADPGVSADTAYDALKVLAASIQRSNTLDPQQVSKELHTVRNFSGASGVFSFNEKGAVEKNPVLWRVIRDSYERVNP